MGKGNWVLQNGNEREASQVYIDLDIPEDATDWSMEFEDLIIFLESLLPKSFERTHERSSIHNDFYNYSAMVLFNNRLFAVCVESGGYHWHLGIGITVLPDAPEFADFQMDKIKTKLFDAIADCYKTYKRTGPWTSERYTKSNGR